MNARKGDLAGQALAGPCDPDLAAVLDAVVMLAQRDALEGVHAVVTERLRQVADLGYTVNEDIEQHGSGWLAAEAIRRMTTMVAGLLDGSADHIGAIDACRQAASLLMAEVDRVNAELMSDSITVNLREGDDADVPYRRTVTVETGGLL